jgi:ferredoxin-NADP reductase
LHDILAPVIIITAFLHIWFTGQDVQNSPGRIVTIILFVAVVLIIFYHLVLRPMCLRRHTYTVADVTRETRNVWTIKLAPPDGREVFGYDPGQFQFLTFHRGRDLPVEEHHWTISSSPTERGYVDSTIKELGDFTSTIGQTRPGDKVTVHAPFGRFSYVHYPHERDLVFIAGGIGITPLMSMLRHMRDTQATVNVLLIYANRNEDEIVFREELAEIESGEYPRLKVVHVLSNPDEGWTGERGRIDRGLIEKYCQDNLRGKTFYLCGPRGLINATIKSLRSLGVPISKIRIEIFSFLD